MELKHYGEARIQNRSASVPSEATRGPKKRSRSSKERRSPKITLGAKEESTLSEIAQRNDSLRGRIIPGSPPSKLGVGMTGQLRFSPEPRIDNAQLYEAMARCVQQEDDKNKTEEAKSPELDG